MFGVSMAAVGMLSIVGMIISNDAYGPIVDNARGLAEMGELGEDIVEITDKLDSAGNTVKAITKGFSIGAAVPAVFSSLLMLGVDRNAQRMVGEIHRQFKEIPGIMEGKSYPEYDKCISIATSGALKELIP